tara:strand:- start:302 stop:520 length:219 start_codon:yes stop_codon:yes gene_type:complete
MRTNQYKDMLKEVGIADTRVEDIHQGMQALWSAYVQLDLSGARAFNKFVGERTVREALIQWAETQPGNNADL